MNENNGFILKPEMYNQEEWYKMFMKSIETINNLQSKIDKVNELIETYKNERDTYKRLAEEYIKKYNDLLERTKEGE